MDITTHFKKSQVSHMPMHDISVVGYQLNNLSLLENARAIKALEEYSQGNPVDVVHLQLPHATIEALCVADESGKEPRVDTIGHACLLVSYARGKFEVFYTDEHNVSTSLDMVKDVMMHKGKKSLYEIHMAENDETLKALLHEKGFIQPNT